ncbi:hypothetical protein DFH07DRAFT_727985 [Mycena maculata]|uniref:F-box domain-containing protein n=1 Tax=Mycena maculata TaxID=230809 RepID=A0AAD7P0D8_9AGAR|nr:hypothetical protein DFH07DRAFT_727985 [Mycena maculata]
MLESSAFSLKLGTNYCPNDREIVEIKALLVVPISRIKRLDDEIAELQKAVDNLTNERESVRADVDAHKALISPARRLPLDVIQEIFMACIPTHRNCVMSAREAPVLLGRICSSWRAISLSTPRLWASLHIAEPPRPFHEFTSPLHEKKLVQRLETTKTWLARSGQCPLSLSVDTHDDHRSFAPDGAPTPPSPNLILRALAPFASRWQDVSFTVSISFIEALSSIATDDVPMLRKLQIKQRPDSAPHGQGIQWESFGLLRGPNITSFALRGSNVNPSSFPLQWENLTNLTVMGHEWSSGTVLTSRMAVQVLSKCPRIRKFRCIVNDSPQSVSAEEASPNSPLVLPSLRSLEITSLGIPALTIRELVTHLSLPELRYFDFRGRSGEGSHIAFAPFLARATLLESLHIESNTFTKLALIELLRALPPTMQRLRITDRSTIWEPQPLDDETFSALIPSADNPTPSCPALQELLIPQCSGPVSDEVLLRFIAARMAVQPVTLKRVEIQFTRERIVDVQPDIQRFVDEGLKVSITYNPPAIWHFSPWQGLVDAPSPNNDIHITFTPFLATTVLLESLEIGTEPFTKPGLLDLLHALPPTIQRLRITDHNHRDTTSLDDDTFSALILSADNSTKPAGGMFESSPFSSRLGTNYCPRDDEILEIQTLLVEPSSRLKGLDDEIAELQKVMDKLTDECNSVRAYVDAHSALISPARRLPVDIIQEIFMACIPTHRNCVMSAREAPVLLGRICSSWRAISLSTPRLWASLHIAYPTRPFHEFTSPLHEKKLVRRLETTKTWLARSGQCPLSISVDSRDDHRSFAPDGASTSPSPNLILQVLAPFASRWQDVSFTVSISFIETLSSIATDDVPMLKKLQIRQDYDSAPHGHGIQWESFGLLRGPNIASFALRSSNVNPLSFPLQWENLTDLTVMGHEWSPGSVLTSRMAVQVLSKCPRIQKFRCIVDDSPQSVSAEEASPDATLVLRSLRSLQITSVGVPALTIHELGSYLSLPELRHFDFHGRSSNDDIHITFAPFLATAMLLESLEIETKPLTKPGLLDLLHALPPTIQRLRITDHNIGDTIPLDDDTFSALILSADNPTVSCPILQELHITHSYGAVSDETLLRFIIARMADQPVTLKRIEIQFHREMLVDIQPDIQQFVDGGLKVSIKYNPPLFFQFSPWQGLVDAPSSWNANFD